jgi:molecular chaperone DnaJ
MSALDYYRILGISPRSSLEEVRRRYRTLAMQYHPDRNPDDPEAAAHFRQVVEAFEAIQSAKTRKKRPASQNYRTPRFTDREQMFEEFFGIPRAGAPLQRSAGANFRYDLQIPFASAIRGMQTVIELDRPLDCHHCRGTGLAAGSGYRDCPDCQGRGRRFGGPGLLRFGPLCDRCGGRGRIVSQACGHCHGAGCQPVRRQYRLQIPPGTEDGTRLRFTGEGGSGFLDGPAGSLEVVIHVAPDEIFTRVGNDIHCRVMISFAEAALGGTIRIPTLEGSLSFQLPQGTQTGWTFRFPGAGAPGHPHQRPGDQVTEVVVATPQNLSPRQKSLLEELARLEWDQPDDTAHE